jgi:hypothetical protein
LTGGGTRQRRGATAKNNFQNSIISCFWIVGRPCTFPTEAAMCGAAQDNERQSERIRHVEVFRFAGGCERPA